MIARHTAKFRTGMALGVMGAAVLVAGCGTSSSTSSSAAAAQAPASASASAGSQTVAPASATHVVIATANGPGGMHLVGASGRAVYLWAADSGGKSRCSGACAQAWPPVLTKTRAVAAHGVKAADLGTTSGAGGSQQVTYNGHPLYYFVADTKAGTTKGQGSTSFGASWWLVTPSGSAITTGAAPAPASSSASSSAGGGYG